VSSDAERDTTLLALCERTFKDGGVLIFAHTRARAHRVRAPSPLSCGLPHFPFPSPSSARRIRVPVAR